MGYPAGTRLPGHEFLPQEPHLLPGSLTTPALRLSLGPFPSSSSFSQEKLVLPPSTPPTPNIYLQGMGSIVEASDSKNDWMGYGASFFDPYFLSLRVNRDGSSMRLVHYHLASDEGGLFPF